MIKKVLSVLLTFVSFAVLDIILGHFLFKNEINIVETLITSGVFCLLYYFIFPRLDKSKEKQKNSEE
jgi:hypothetical protein